MRMWMLPPQLLCDKHLLGEHGEIHKHRHNFVKQHSITGRVSPVVLIEPANMELWHDELATEMTRRGMNHQSPYTLPDLSYLPEHERTARVNRTVSVDVLCARCSACRERIKTPTTV